MHESDTWLFFAGIFIGSFAASAVMKSSELIGALMLASLAILSGREFLIQLTEE